MRISKKSGAGRQRGIAAIEFAAILPVILILLAFTMFFGRMAWHIAVAHKAAHDALTVVAASRIAEITEAKSDLSEIEIVRFARTVAVTEWSELNPGNNASPVVDINCDGFTCRGNAIPTDVSIMVRMRVFDSLFPAWTNEMVGTDGLWISAELRMRYVGY